MRENIVAITQTEARSAAETVLKRGGTKQDVAREAMRAARGGFLAPDEGEAFAAAVGALWSLYPDDDDLRQETRSIGDRNKVLSAVANGVPVDFDALELTPLPETQVGLLTLWNETRRV